LASRKFNPKPPRYFLEASNTSFAIWDRSTLTYIPCPPGTTRTDAERMCARRNRGAVAHRERHPMRRRRIQSMFTKSADFVGVDGLYRIKVRGEPQRPTVSKEQRRELVTSCRDWLPPMLKDWANVVATQMGFGDRRAAWPAVSILTMLSGPFFFLTEVDKSVRELHFEVMPNNQFEPRSPEDNRQREALCLHYLSTATTAQKAGFLGVSKATYLRYVEAAHRLVAQRWIP
jgi:hypothetical protein